MDVSDTNVESAGTLASANSDQVSMTHIRAFGLSLNNHMIDDCDNIMINLKPFFFAIFRI